MSLTANSKRKRTYSDDEDLENNPPNNPTVCLEAEEENVWADELLSPDSGCLDSVEPCSDPSSEMESPDGNLRPREPHFSKTWCQFRSLPCPLTPMPERQGPLPMLRWADPQEVWDLMCHKNEVSMSQRDEDLFTRHPQIQPRMRTILLDWIIEVCEVYKLHRETYHLAIDFIDRYLSSRKDIPKGHLQLIGITCLFISAKVEEIYPPKLAEFSYVTDGACTDKEILEQEIIILKALNWNLSPVTVNGWLTMYSQLCVNAKIDVPTSEDTFVFPQFSGLTFVQTAQLIDLVTLDEGCLRFSYSVLAASALWHMASHELALAVSGLSWDDISECVSWTLPFALTVHDERSIPLPSNVKSAGNATSSGLLKAVPNIVVDNSHNIQTHLVDLDMLDRARERRLELQEAESTSVPDSPMELSSAPTDPGLLTPPASHKKPSEHQAALAGSFT